jgi:uncharacterized protein (DUF2147 family)
VHFKNRLRGALSGAFAALLLTSGAVLAQNADNPPALDPTGEWLVAKKVARIRIVNCDDRIWGVVSWEVRPGIDRKNPDKALSTRPTLGMPILLGMTQTAPNKWKGEIYNSEDGRKYDASISLLDPDTLKVQGCVLGFLCGGENWSRVGPPDFESADEASGQPANGRNPSGATQKFKQPANRQPNRPNGKAQSTRPPANRPPAGPPGAAENAAATSEMIESEPPGDICSRVAGVPGLPH